MRYETAMQKIHRKGKLVAKLGDMRIMWKFGHNVMITGPGTFIAYTPTLDDMQDTGWVVETAWKED